MLQLSPVTYPDDGFDDGPETKSWAFNSGYHRVPGAKTAPILGFGHTALSGTGMHDGGDFVLFPCSGICGPQDRAFGQPRLVHHSEHAEPGYYKADLVEDRAVMSVELAAGRRAGLMRVTWHGGWERRMRVRLQTYLDKLRMPSSVGVRHAEGSKRLDTLAGTRSSSKIHHCSADHTVYWHATFEPPFLSFRRVSESFEYEVEWGRRTRNVTVRVGISHVSEEGARENAELEVAQRPFRLEALRADARSAWQKALGAIQVTAPEPERRRFYTALYHSMLGPTLLSDATGHFPGGGDNAMFGRRAPVLKADGYEHFSTFSLWDTYRAHQPLMNLIQPELAEAFARSLLSPRQGATGTSPLWLLYGQDVRCMTGNPAAPFLADMALKGLVSQNVSEEILKMLTAAADQEPFVSEGQRIPAGQEYCVSRGLEHAVADSCIARLADRLGDQRSAAAYRERGQLFREYFDPEAELMLPHLSDGTVLRLQDDVYDQDGWEGQPFFQEGTPLQYLFHAQHDVPGLTQLLGGPEKLAAKLDRYFYGKVHADHTRPWDMTTGNFGGHCQGNEPGHHVPFLYNAAGQSWKTQELVAKLRDMYGEASAGELPGQDDVGQMSAWFVWATLGLYPVDPCGSDYEISRPFVEEASVRLGKSGAVLRIKVEDAAPGHDFVQEVRFNGELLTKTTLAYDLVRSGGTLAFKLGPERRHFASEAPPTAAATLPRTTPAVTAVSSALGPAPPPTPAVPLPATAAAGPPATTLPSAEPAAAGATEAGAAPELAGQLPAAEDSTDGHSRALLVGASPLVAVAVLYLCRRRRGVPRSVPFRFVAAFAALAAAASTVLMMVLAPSSAVPEPAGRVGSLRHAPRRSAVPTTLSVPLTSTSTEVTSSSTSSSSSSSSSTPPTTRPAPARRSKTTPAPTAAATSALPFEEEDDQDLTDDVNDLEGPMQPWQRRRSPAHQRLVDYQDHGRAAVVYLVSNRVNVLKDLYSSLHHLNRNFCSQHGMGERYPVLLFVEGCQDNVTANFFRQVAPACQLRWVDDFADYFHTVPDFAREAAEAFRQANPNKPGYAKMIRWYFRGLYEHPLVRDLDYVIRMDTDSMLLSPFNSNPVHTLRSARKKYGYFCGCAEGEEWVVGLNVAAAEFMHSRNITSHWWIGMRRYEPRDEDPVSMPYNNFEIVDVRWWRSRKVQDFVEFIDHKLGIFKHRWGDAPLRGIAISFFLRPRDIYQFEELRYTHPAMLRNLPVPFTHVDRGAVQEGWIPENFDMVGICRQEGVTDEEVSGWSSVSPMTFDGMCKESFDGSAVQASLASGKGGPSVFSGDLMSAAVQQISRLSLTDPEKARLLEESLIRKIKSEGHFN